MTDEPSAEALQEQIAAVREIVVRYGLADHDGPEHLYTAMRTVLATLEAQAAKDEVIEAARNLGEAMNNAQDCDAEFRALWTALDLADATALPPAPDKEPMT